MINCVSLSSFSSIEQEKKNSPALMERNSQLRTTIGDPLLKTVGSSRVLMVGAGGIGCELLKNLVMSGFQDIVIIDLDTIDLSNLNRQFLFQKQHIKKSKAKIARESALEFNPNVNIEARHQNIKEEEFSVEWFKGFDLVMNALDNLDARRHVNKMCLAAKVPLIESGTAGYLGQVTVISGDRTECFDCLPKETPKTFPVCTIRSTPSTPIHCIVWAKSYLFGLLFGNAEDDDDEVMVKDDSADDETAKELETLKAESQALKTILAQAGQEGFTELVFNKVFGAEIERLRKMEDMWKTRAAPTPLNYSQIMDITGHLSQQLNVTSPESTTLKDQRVWTLPETVTVFGDSLVQLTARLQNLRESDPEASISFDKDDAETLDFVTATANLRAHVYGIEEKSRFDVKAMAGNIIPAIATTNAIVAGLMVMLAFKIMNNRIEDCKTTYLVYDSRGDRDQLLISEKLAKPSPRCYICRNSYIGLKIDTTTSTVQDFVSILEDSGMTDVEIQENGRVIHDPDFDDNLGKTLAELQLTNGKFVDVVDEDDRKVIVYIIHRDSADLDGEKFILDGDVEHALVQQDELRKTLDQLKAADAAEEAAEEARKAAATAAHRHVGDMDIVMLDDTKKRKRDGSLEVLEDEPLKKSSLSETAHPSELGGGSQQHQAPLDGVGDGTSREQAVDVDEVVMVDGEEVDVVILE